MFSGLNYRVVTAVLGQLEASINLLAFFYLTKSIQIQVKQSFINISIREHATLVE